MSINKFYSVSFDEINKKFSVRTFAEEEPKVTVLANITRWKYSDPDRKSFDPRIVKKKCSKDEAKKLYDEFIKDYQQDWIHQYPKERWGFDCKMHIIPLKYNRNALAHGENPWYVDEGKIHQLTNHYI